MTQVLIYDCPSCTASCSVSPELVGLNVVCPNCTQEFSATHPESAADLQLPDAIPFFKSGKLEILKNHLNKLTSDGELSKSDEIALTRAALMLGLKEKDFVVPRYFQWSHARGSLLTLDDTLTAHAIKRSCYSNPSQSVAAEDIGLLWASRV